MLFGLLDDDTSLYEDPAKMALFGAGLGLANSRGVTGADFLRDAITGAGQGYGAYQQTRLQQAQMESERKKQELENLYKMAQIRKMQYEMQEPQRAQTQEQQKQQMLREQLQGLGLPEEQERLLIAQSLLNPSAAATELGEIRNERLRNKTTQALQAFMQKQGFEPELQNLAMEIIGNSGDNVKAGYEAAKSWLDKYGAEAKGADKTVDLQMFASTIQTPWDTTGNVKQTAMSMLQRGQSVNAALDYIKAMRESMKPTEDDNMKMSSSGSSIIYKNLPAVQKNGLWYRPDGTLLPGGGSYIKAADGKGLIFRTNDEAQKKVYGAGLGINILNNFAQAITNKAESIGGLGNVGIKLDTFTDAEELAELRTQYIEVLMSLKTSYELGALTGPDTEILEGAIKDPTSLGSQTAQSLLKSLMVIQKRMANEFATYAKKLNQDPRQLLESEYQQIETTDLGLTPLTQLTPRSPQGAAGRAGATGGIKTGSPALQRALEERQRKEAQLNYGQ